VPCYEAKARRKEEIQINGETLSPQRRREHREKRKSAEKKD
jgi:hypothetical protein